jgi:hypothetical protein
MYDTPMFLGSLPAQLFGGAHLCEKKLKKSSTAQMLDQ